MSSDRDFWFSDVDWAKENHLSDIDEIYRELFKIGDRKNYTNESIALGKLAAIAKNGSLAASLYLAIYYDRRSNNSGHEKALEWYKFSAALGSKSAAFRAAAIQLDNDVDTDIAEKSLWNLSRIDFAPAQYRLARHLIEEDKEQNREIYIELLRQSSKNGHFFAKRDLGTFIVLNFPRNPNLFEGIWLILSSMLLPIFENLLKKRGNNIYHRIYG